MSIRIQNCCRFISPSACGSKLTSHCEIALMRANETATLLSQNFLFHVTSHDSVASHHINVLKDEENSWNKIIRHRRVGDETQIIKFLNGRQIWNVDIKSFAKDKRRSNSARSHANEITDDKFHFPDGSCYWRNCVDLTEFIASLRRAQSINFIAPKTFRMRNFSEISFQLGSVNQLKVEYTVNSLHWEDYFGASPVAFLHSNSNNLMIKRSQYKFA